MFFKKKKSTFIENDKSDLSFSEVDRIAEADVYLAYGRKSQALSILNEALESGRLSPERHANFLKEKNLNDSAEQEFLDKIAVSHDLSFNYYISLTAGNNEKTIRSRLFLKLKNEINTRKGVEELEEKIEVYVQEIFSNMQELLTWTIDNYIEMEIE